MPNIGPLELGIVLLIVLLVFGPKKLPELGHSMGRTIRGFRKEIGHGDPPPAETAASGEAATTAAERPPTI